MLDLQFTFRAQCAHRQHFANMKTNIDALRSAAWVVDPYKGRQSALADKIGMSQTVMSEILRGKRPMPLRFGVKVHEVTGKSLKEIYPDDWPTVWPHLKDSENANTNGA